MVLPPERTESGTPTAKEEGLPEQRLDSAPKERSADVDAEPSQPKQARHSSDSSGRDLTPNWWARLIDWAGSRAPYRIQQFGYAALFFLLIAGVAGAVAQKSGGLVMLILLLVLVFGLAMALYFFGQMASKESPIWHFLGTLLCYATFAAIATAFCWVVYLATTGQLQSVLSGVTPPIPSLASEPEVGSESVAFRLNPLHSERDTVTGELWLRTGTDDVIIASRALATTVLKFQNLKQGTRYLLRLRTHRGFLESPSYEATFVTRAKDLPLKWGDTFPPWKITYSGPMSENSEAVATGSASIRMEGDGDVWLYEGPVTSGLPDGDGGTITLVGGGEDSCNRTMGRTCVAHCEHLVFKQGRFMGGYCSLTFGKDTKTVRVATYRGKVGGAGEPWQVVLNGLSLGPWQVHPHGAGYMSMNVGSSAEGTFSRGELSKGVFLNELAVSHGRRTREHPAGLLVELTTASFRIAANGTYSGQWLPGNSGFLVARRDKNVSREITIPPRSGSASDCVQNEDFGVFADVVELVRHRNWEFQGDPGESVRMQLPEVGVFIYAYYSPGNSTDTSPGLPWRSSAPSLGMAVAGLDRKAKNEFQFDDRAITLERYSPQERGPYAVGTLCTASTLTNLINGKQLSLEGLCPTVALVLARHYYCHGPWKMP